MKKIKWGLVLSVVVILFGINNSYATPYLELKLDDGLGHVITAQDLNNDGVVTFNGNLGNWVINVTTGITYPTLGSTTQPLLDLNSVNVSSGNGGNLNIQVSASGYTWLGEGVLSIGGTTNGTVAASAYYDSSNVLFAQTSQIGSNLSFSPISFSGQTNSTVVDISPSSPYSLTIDVDINHQSGGVSSFDGQLAVPEPGTLLFLGAGLLGLGFAVRQRMKNNPK
jgi:hypothetical protein